MMAAGNTIKSGAGTSLPDLFFETKGTGHPVLLIAGLGVNHLFWWRQVDVLSQKYRVILPDNRDAGRSPLASGPYTVSDMADDMARLLQKINAVPAHVVGISMGGFISLNLALRYPEMVTKLVLVSTSPGGPAHVPAGPELGEVLMRVEGEGVEERMRRILPFITGPGFTGSHPEDVDRHVAIFVENPMADEPYERQTEAILRHARSGVSDRLGAIKAPTLVVHGTADRVIPYANGAYLATHLPHVRFSAYEGVGHLPPLEAATQFTSELLEFFGASQ
jgi:3-oxoadipate enol-lactonase